MNSLQGLSVHELEARLADYEAQLQEIYQTIDDFYDNIALDALHDELAEYDDLAEYITARQVDEYFGKGHVHHEEGRPYIRPESPAFYKRPPVLPPGPFDVRPELQPEPRPEFSRPRWYQGPHFAESSSTSLDQIIQEEVKLRRKSIDVTLAAKLAVSNIQAHKASITPSGRGSDAHDWPAILEPHDRARKLTKWELRGQRLGFLAVVLGMNIACLCVALIGPVGKGWWVLCFILFIKSKDFLSAVYAMVCLPLLWIWHKIRPPKPIEPQWILTLIPAYSESEEQITNTVFSLRDNGTEPHKQVMCIILDGKERNIRQHMTRMVKSFTRPYVTSKARRGTLKIYAGFMKDVPVIVFEKVKNAGKKDSLILCHDLFNIPRQRMPLYIKMLRDELWRTVLPILTDHQLPNDFDMIFCTDADSIIHKKAVFHLTEALARDKQAIAACGLVLVEFKPGFEWSMWNLYQQYQYCFGQYVRRRAETLIGKVTCLPGCITMIRVRPEMAGAIRKYAEPITGYAVILHQVQYLGTDRRLTYSMLSQAPSLRTLFVPAAVSETEAPQSLRHYLSQRRRWGSNAYFNNYFYCFGEKMVALTRLAAFVEITRTTFVYYRLCNTALFIHNLVTDFSFRKILPLLIVSQMATLWFWICVLFLSPLLRRKAHKLAIALLINKFMAPAISVMVFSSVIRNLGSQVWGMTGGTAAQQAAVTGQVSAQVVEAARKGSVTAQNLLLIARDGHAANPADVIPEDLEEELHRNPKPPVNNAVVDAEGGRRLLDVDSTLDAELEEQIAKEDKFLDLQV